MRYTPDVASRPERLEKDLANAKILASQLEEEAAILRKTKLQKQPAADQTAEGGEGGDGQDSKGDVAMADGQVEEDEEDEPKERGSDAVERRIEKVMGEMRDQGLVDTDDEKAFQDKKVGGHRFVLLTILTSSL